MLEAGLNSLHSSDDLVLTILCADYDDLNFNDKATGQKETKSFPQSQISRKWQKRSLHVGLTV